MHLVQAWALWSHGAPAVDALVGVRTEHARVLLGGQAWPLVPREPWRLLTSVWVHVDGLHLLLNATALATLGRVLEPWVGPRRLWFWFLMGGVLGSVVPQLLRVARSDGASGGAFALLAAVSVLAWRHRRALPPDEARVLGPGFALLLVGNLALSAVVPQVDITAHLGGTAAGLLLAWVPDTRVARAIEWSAMVACVAGYVWAWL